MAPGEKQREHRPRDLGPRVYLQGSTWRADMRPWSGPDLPSDLPDRPTLRNPEAEGWPYAGSLAESEGEARKWSWHYVALYSDETRRREGGRERRPLPLLKAAEMYLRHRRAAVAYNTFSSDRSSINHLIEHLGRSASTGDLKADDLQEYADDLVLDGYQTSTARTICKGWRAFGRWWFGETAGPLGAVKPPALLKSEARGWSEDEIARLREAADRVDFARRRRPPSARLALEIGLNIGPRQQEIFALDWEGVNAERESAYIYRQMVKDGRSFVNYTKGRKARSAFVLPPFWQFYDEAARGLMLCNTDGSAIGSQSRLQKELIQRVLDTAGLNGPGVGWHSLRHTYSRLCLEEYQVTLDELSMFLGHASRAVTEQIYGHYAPSRAIDNVRERVRRAGERPQSLKVMK